MNENKIKNKMKIFLWVLGDIVKRKLYLSIEFYGIMYYLNKLYFLIR